ncbi:MAG: PASTA domain-containing protein [Egibacteraceae bacterium]
MSPSPSTRQTVGDAAVGAFLGGRYRLLARIGAGGMATIYRAHDEVLDRDVAVKVLHGHLADDETVLERFRTEAKHAAALTHAHIVNVYDQGAAGLPYDLPYIVMEHVDGPSLREVLNRRGRLRPGQALSVIGPVCMALARAHAAGVVHRDVKPENVLITPDGVPKVADFGIARALESTNLTQTGALIGSVHYLAPELVSGNHATPASDQYAVGVLLFELLTGRKALPAETPMAVALRHAGEPIPPAGDFVSDVDPELDEVIARATALEAHDRYPSLAAFAAAVADAIPSGPEPVEIADGPTDGAATLVIAAADATEIVGTTDDTLPRAGMARVGGRKARTPARHPRRDQRRRRWPVVVAVVVLLLGLLAGGGYAMWDQVVAPVQTLPALAGMTQEEATAELAGIGFSLEVADERNDLSAPAGTILAQDPDPGTEERRGGSVAVTVSAGPATVEVPQVVGLEETEAIALLEGDPYHFAIALDEGFSDTAPAGVIRAQAPEEGGQLRQGDRVAINVSLGVEQVEVPDVAGRPQDEAEAAIADARLTLGEVTGQFSDDQPEAGAVISQSLDARARVDKGSTIDLVVSRGPLTVEMPEVEGQPVGEARDALEALGLQVRLESEEVPTLGPFVRGRVGVVEVQEPAAGTEVQRGDEVVLYFFRAPDEDDDD